MALTVACVLRSGGDFKPEHVQELRAGVRKHLLSDHRFVCLSDVAVPGVDTVPLPHAWPGWWAKICLFRPGIFSGRVLYLDLDSVVVGSLEEIASYNGRLAMLSDFFEPEKPASGVMAWEAGEGASAYNLFVGDPRAVMGTLHGDQDWLARGLLLPPKRLQDLFPGQLVSWKRHCSAGIPEGARIVSFHGRPRPWEVEL